MDDILQPTCFAGMQAMGTLLGTMFGFVSAALLTPVHGEEGENRIPAVPGVIIGSSLGVLAAHSAGEGNQPVRHVAYLFASSVGGAAGPTAACSWLVGDMLRNSGSVGIMVLATVASLGSTAVFTMHNHSMMLRRAATATATRGDMAGERPVASDHDPRRHGFSRARESCALPYPKEV